MVEPGNAAPNFSLASSTHKTISLNDFANKKTVVLYFYLDLPVDEVATVTGKSVGATRTRLHRAMRKLRPGVAIEEALS